MNHSQLRNFFLPLTGTVTLREKLTAGITAFVGMVIITYVSMLATGTEGLIIMAASMGSAAVLLFAVPHSPMSQPWPMIGGHLVSALVGVMSYQLLNSPPLAAGLAVASAIIAMFFLRCLNPPSGAIALGAVLGGPEIHNLGYLYVLFPVGFNVLVIFVVALIINNSIPGRRYPLMPEEEPAPQQGPDGLFGRNTIQDEDLDSALEEMDSFLDADREDLQKLFSRATRYAFKRRLGRVVCEDIMSSSAFTFNESMGLFEAWRSSATVNHRFVPVLDKNGLVCGLLSIAELMRYATKNIVTGLSEATEEGQAPELSVSMIMSTSFQTADRKDHIVDLIPLFNEQHVRLLLVLDSDNHLSGIISRSDLMRALLPVRI